MLAMSQINHIKDLSNCGYRISEISKETGTNIVRQKTAEPLAVAMRAVVGSRDRLKHIIEKQGSCV